MRRTINQRITQVTKRIADGDWRISTPLFFILFAFYFLTAAGNLSETDDVYAFAYRAENFAIGHVSDPRLMLYHMAMRTLYLAASVTGLDISALSLMRLFSSLCAAASLLLLVRVLTSGFKLPAVTAIIGAGLLGSCYGFWRYAAEAEVYIPSILLCLLLFKLLSDAQAHHAARLRFVAIGALAGLAILFYQPNAIPLIFAFPFLILDRERIAPLILYLSSAGLIVIGGYLGGYFLYWPEPLSLQSIAAFLSQRSGEFVVPPLSVRTVIVSIVGSAFALSQDIASANWIFGFDPVVRLINRAFSNNVTVEGIFLARRAGAVVFLPLASLVLLLTLSIRIIHLARPLPLRHLFTRRLLVVTIWLVLNSMVIGRLNPEGTEAWIVVLPPVTIIAAVLLFNPSIAKGRSPLVVALVGVLFLHNAVGGMALVSNPANEYDRVKGSWIISNATQRDLVIVTDDAGMSESLRYLSKAEVALIRSIYAPFVAHASIYDQLSKIPIPTYGRDFGGNNLSELITQTWDAGGRVIVFDEFFLRGRPSETTVSSKQDPLRLLKEKAQVVYHSPELGSTYVLNRPIP